MPWVCLASLAVTLAVSASGCATAHTVLPRHTAELRPGWLTPISWFTPSLRADEATLSRWRRAVGPPVLQLAPSPIPTRTDEITVVSWNIANGAGDVRALLATLPSDRPVVLLLQEAFRGGQAVPLPMEAGAFFAGRLGGLKADESALTVEALAAALGFNLYYVPSMRNGGPLSDEDRGNAILTNLPLSDPLAIELPFERQRRVAVAATVSGVSASGEPWHIRMVSAHLDGFASMKYGWLGGEFGRARQARALRDATTRDGAVVLGADLNTWFGFTERAYVETAAAFPDTRVTDQRATFGGLMRLDHLFFRLDDGWHAEFSRADDRHGSDHFPLIATIRAH